jgi:acyl-CoA thioester hydrolase
MHAVRVPIEVRFRDLDALGHVNNAVFLTYLEVARLAFVQALGLLEDAGRVPILVARAEIDYRRPVHLGDDLEVEVRVHAVGRKSFTLAYEVNVGGAVHASALSVQVWMDVARGVSVPIPDRERALLTASMELPA